MIFFFETINDFFFMAKKYQMGLSIVYLFSNTQFFRKTKNKIPLSYIQRRAVVE